MDLFSRTGFNSVTAFGGQKQSNPLAVDPSNKTQLLLPVCPATKALFNRSSFDPGLNLENGLEVSTAIGSQSSGTQQKSRPEATEERKYIACLFCM